MSTMDAPQASLRPDPGIPVNRFALFSETILAGVIVLLLSVPLVTAPAAYAAGVAHLERHLSGRDDSLRSLWGNFPRSASRQLEAGNHDGGSRRRDCPEPVARPGGATARPGSDPARHADSGRRQGAVLLLRIAANWSGGVNWERRRGPATHRRYPARRAWALAYRQAKADSLRDWTGSLLLACRRLHGRCLRLDAAGAVRDRSRDPGPGRCRHQDPFQR